MLRPTAVKVTPIGNFHLSLVYDTGEKGIFDVRPYMHGPWYSELKDPAYFKKVTVDGISVCWPDGQDIDPNDLYYNSEKM